MLARVLWFLGNSQEDLAAKAAWGTALSAAQALYIVLASLAYRQFGWRLYAKLGVDYRQRDAEGRARAGVLTNAFYALVKLDLMMLVRGVAGVRGAAGGRVFGV